MSTEKTYPKNLIEAVRYFSDLDVAHEFFASVRWPDGKVCCPHCGSVAVKYLANYRRWECKEKHPRRQFTVKVGTIMEDSALGLDKWAVGFWLEVNAKNSISSYEIHRALGITQKSAWFMLHRIRLAVQSKSFDKMGGDGSAGVEADETFIGGKGWNRHIGKKPRGRGPVGKAIVMGLLERHSEKKKKQIRASVIPARDAMSIQSVIHKNVEYGSNVFSDALYAYRGLDDFFEHQIIDHAERYVDGVIHTNGLENFWSLLKRCIKGTHVSIDPAHLGAYIDSEAFRFNNRDTDDAGRFRLALSGMTGKRLTYKSLIGELGVAPGSDRIAENGNGDIMGA